MTADLIAHSQRAAFRSLHLPGPILNALVLVRLRAALRGHDPAMPQQVIQAHEVHLVLRLED